ncbi:MAG: hypothetical protein H6581_10500 [Bacteroidia bacterium]|nr:hypothetical protein [Bacteroidia bacterium]
MNIAPLFSFLYLPYVRIRSMDMKTLTFLSTILHIPQTDFRCYNDKQSSLRHYPY